MENQFTTREQIIEIANKLFVYTDNRQWQRLQDEVFSESVLFDMSSLGAGDPVELPAKQICDGWQQGFEGIDAVHHQAGNYLVTINTDEATVTAYAIALHYKKSATQGKPGTSLVAMNLGSVFNLVKVGESIHLDII